MKNDKANGQVLILMGVSGSGKTTVGNQLANHLGWDYLEGDDFHPEANIAKMADGQPLNDIDREPWLKNLNLEIKKSQSQQQSMVVSCSALKRTYRELLIDGVIAPVYVYLSGDFETIAHRMEMRGNHFMKADMLRSQFEVLEPPGADEAVTVDIINYSVEEIVKEILILVNENS